MRPTTIGLRERIRCPKIGYSTRDFLTTKATRLSGWMIVGSTNASSVLMWLPMKTQGPSSRLKCWTPVISNLTPTASSARST